MIIQYYLFTTILNDYLRIDKNINNQGNHYDLFLLFLSFQGYRDWIFIDKTPDIVFITQHFFGDDENKDVVVEIDAKNYDYILQKWQQVLQQRPQYFILSCDDHGWIDLEMKNELSLEDQKYVDQDKIKKLQD